MKTALIVVIILISSLLFADEIYSRDWLYNLEEVKLDSLEQAKLDSVCNIRGHSVIECEVKVPGVKPLVIDLENMTIMYFYPDDIMTGTIYLCQRCRKFIGYPKINAPRKRVLWKEEKKKEDNINGGQND